MVISNWVFILCSVKLHTFRNAYYLSFDVQKVWTVSSCPLEFILGKYNLQECTSELHKSRFCVLWTDKRPLSHSPPEPFRFFSLAALGIVRPRFWATWLAVANYDWLIICFSPYCVYINTPGELSYVSYLYTYHVESDVKRTEHCHSEIQLLWVIRVCCKEPYFKCEEVLTS